MFINQIIGFVMTYDMTYDIVFKTKILNLKRE